jgi:hypothetical protein
MKLLLNERVFNDGHLTGIKKIPTTIRTTTRGSVLAIGALLSAAVLAAGLGYKAYDDYQKLSAAREQATKYFADFLDLTVIRVDRGLRVVDGQAFPNPSSLGSDLLSADGALVLTDHLVDTRRSGNPVVDEGQLDCFTFGTSPQNLQPDPDVLAADAIWFACDQARLVTDYDKVTVDYAIDLEGGQEGGWLVGLDPSGELSFRADFLGREAVDRLLGRENSL